MNNRFDVFVDGGVALRNPSPYGGSWAWCYIHDGAVVRECSGVVLPIDIGLVAISNNVSEILAAIRALESAPDGWQGRLFTDSQVTLLRLAWSDTPMRGVPQGLIERVVRVRQRHGLKQERFVLLDGHPTKAQLAAGRGKRGDPVSVWNQRCDQECRRLCEELLAKQGVI